MSSSKMSQASTSSQQPVRVMLWGMARSLTTVFEKCISFVDDIQVINEAFAAAKAIGPEREENDITSGVTNFMDKASAAARDEGFNCWDDDVCTFQWVKDTMEADYPGKKIIFCKDIVTTVIDHYDMIPKGYRHTFIIRNPIKAFISLRKLVLKNFLPANIPLDQLNLKQMQKMRAQVTGKDLKNPFQQTLELVEYLKDHGEAHPVIVDADDLQNHPASILKQYCEAVGIPYSDSLLQWEAGDEIVKKNWYVSKTLMNGNKMGDYYGTALASTKFLPAAPVPPLDQISPDVVSLSKEAEPFYQKLYDMRIRP